jgi:DeoR/GlpR family transcriptional regulator of sugar metabolism
MTEKETKFRDWLIKYLDEHTEIETSEACAAGAVVCDCSIETTRRYLNKMGYANMVRFIHTGGAGRNLVVKFSPEQHKKYISTEG